MGTGKSQAMTITGGSALGKDDIDRMMREAEAARRGGPQRREDAEVRNQAESLVYQTEKFVKENDEKLPADVKDSVNASLGEAQEALKGTDTAAIKAAMEKLATESPEARCGALPAAGRCGSTAGAGAQVPASAVAVRTTSSTPRSWTRTRSDRRDAEPRHRRTSEDGERVVVRDRRRIDPARRGDRCAPAAGRPRRSRPDRPDAGAADPGRRSSAVRGRPAEPAEPPTTAASPS